MKSPVLWFAVTARRSILPKPLRIRKSSPLSNKVDLLSCTTSSSASWMSRNLRSQVSRNASRASNSATFLERTLKTLSASSRRRTESFNNVQLISGPMFRMNFLRSFSRSFRPLRNPSSTACSKRRRAKHDMKPTSVEELPNVPPSLPAALSL